MPSGAFDAVLFDLDGTLVDSEPLHRRAILDVLRGIGVDPGPLEPQEFVGFGEREFWTMAIGRFSLAQPLEELIARKDARYAEIARADLRAMPGASACLERIATQGLVLAVASGSTPRSIAASVSATGIGRWFRTLVSSLDPDVGRSKPAPDVFLAAARRLGVEPARCLVVEDAEYGVAAGKEAGMFVAAIPNTWTAGHDLSRADARLRSLDELDLERLR